MRIASLEVFRYRIPLVSPLKLAGQVHQFREGIVIRVKDTASHSAIAEIAPLPGWHQESLDDAYKQIINKIPHILKRITWEHGANSYQLFLSLDLAGVSYPSVRWGLELALLQLNSNQKGCHLYETLSHSYQDNIQINALLVGDTHKILQDAKNRMAEGYRTLKIKVGRYTVDEEIQLIHNLREVVGSGINIRLDANQSWSITDAVHFGKSVNQSAIEYIEEPLKSSGQLKDFYEETGIFVGLDESLYHLDPDDLELSPGTQYLILKPSRLGGFNQFWHWTKLAKEKQLKVVLSSTFECGITIAALTQLAGTIQPGHLAMGFDTLRWFKEDLLEKNISIHQGQLKVSEVAARGQNVNWEKLKLVKEFEW